MLLLFSRSVVSDSLQPHGVQHPSVTLFAQWPPSFSLLLFFFKPTIVVSKETVITKYHRLSSINNRNLSSWLWRPEVRSQGFGRVCAFRRLCGRKHPHLSELLFCWQSMQVLGLRPHCSSICLFSCDLFCVCIQMSLFKEY